MARINIRIPDATLAALRRELDSERAFRGRRYSMNDLCVRKLGSNGVAAGQQSAAIVDDAMTKGLGYIHITPPPPPVPNPWPKVTMSEWREEPQPEHAARPNPEWGPEVVPEIVVEESRTEDQHAEELMDQQIARAEEEGMPDGHMD